MGDVDTNNVAVAVTIEPSLATPGTRWHLLEVNGEPDLAADLTKITRNPIRKDRNAEKGVVVDLDAAVKLELDITGEHLRQFSEAAFMATANGLAQFTQNNGIGPTAVTATGYTVPSGGAIAAALLIFARGFALAANNGLKVVTSGSTATEVKAAGLSAEVVTAAVNASVEVCGVRGATGDFTINANGDLTATLQNLTLLGLTPGQWVKIGGATAILQFATAADNGWARIKSIAAGLIEFDRWSTTFVADAGAGKTIDVYFGTFHRNVSVDDADWLKRSYHAELAYENLGDAAADAYAYAEGNYVSMSTFDYPLAGKATMMLDFIGTYVNAPTETRLTGASAAIQPVQKLLFNTANEVMHIRLSTSDEAQLDVTQSFKSAKLTLNNNLSGERKMGTLGSAKVNVGRLDAKVELSAWLDSPDALSAALESDTLEFWMAMRNDDGGHLWDIPALSLDSPDQSFPENATVLQALVGVAHKDPVLGTSMSLSRYPYLPES